MKQLRILSFTTQLKLLLLLLILPLLVTGQEKPQIQVSFDIDSSSSLHDFFSSDIENMEGKALNILVEGLNDHIGFLEFSDKETTQKLTIVLKDINNGSIPEYYLYFTLTNADGEYKHEWQFIDPTEESHTFQVVDLLDKLKLDWNDYLENFYNQEIGTNLFDEIPLEIPDGTFFSEDEIKEVVLPLQKDALKINIDKSKFLVFIYAKKESGNELTKQTCTDATATGIKESDPFKGCLRIEVKCLTLSNLLNGKVFITNYVKDNDGNNVVTSDGFLSEENKP